MGELGTTRRYSYWSDRAVRRVTEDHNIDLGRGWRWTARSPSAGFAPQVEATKEPRAVQHHEIALRIERAIGQLAVEDFVTPPPARFVKGVSRVSFAVYTRWNFTDTQEPTKKAVILHTRIKSSDASRVEICLFGSIDNCVGYLKADQAPAPVWSSSSTWAIEEFIEHKGIKAAPVYDDDEEIAVEILRVLNNEGMTDKYAFTADPSSEWFAQVYKDVELDKGRWDLRRGEDIPEPVDRIVIGAPLWVRSSG